MGVMHTLIVKKDAKPAVYIAAQNAISKAAMPKTNPTPSVKLNRKFPTNDTRKRPSSASESSSEICKKKVSKCIETGED